MDRTEPAGQGHRSAAPARNPVRLWLAFFDCQILSHLTDSNAEADRHDARLVLVHLRQKGGFLDLFGPRVRLRGVVSVFQGCGAGHLAGDGLQRPGAFLIRNSRVISRPPAQSAADLPGLPKLFEGLHPSSRTETVTA